MINNIVDRIDKINEEHEKKYLGDEKPARISDIFSKEHKAARIIYAIISVIFFLHAFKMLNFIPTGAALSSAFMGMVGDNIPLWGLPLWETIIIIAAVIVVVISILVIIITIITKKENAYRVMSDLSYKLYLMPVRSLLSGMIKTLSGLLLGFILNIALSFIKALQCVDINETMCPSTIFIFAGSVFLMIAILYDVDMKPQKNYIPEEEI